MGSTNVRGRVAYLQRDVDVGAVQCRHLRIAHGALEACCMLLAPWRLASRCQTHDRSKQNVLASPITRELAYTIGSTCMCTFLRRSPAHPQRLAWIGIHRPDFRSARTFRLPSRSEMPANGTATTCGNRHGRLRPGRACLWL